MSSSPNLMIQIRHIGGQNARNAHSTCASSHREAKYLMHMLGVPIFVAPPMISAQAEKLLSSVEHQILSRGPMTFIGEILTSGQIERVLDEANWARLKQVKDEIDPANRFAFSGSGIRN